MAKTQSNVLRFERKPFAGTFTVRDTALYLRATTPPERTLMSRWRNVARPKKFAATTQALYSWIRNGIDWEEPFRVTAQDRVVTFEDLIRLRVIAFLRSRGYPYAHIKSSEDFVRREFHIPQPFVTERFWLGGPILFQFQEALISVSPGREWQGAFKELEDFMMPVEHGLSFDDDLAAVWRPSEQILIDPEIQFGAPCIEGTRVETEALWSFNQAGDSPQSLAKMYGLDIKQVKAALAWEQRIASAMAA